MGIRDQRMCPTSRTTLAINRYVWDFSVDGPVKWNGAAPFLQTSDSGAMVPPGTYAVRLTLGKKALTRSVRVMADPRTVETQSQIVASFAYAQHCNAQLSIVDTMLNNLDAASKSLSAASARSENAGNSPLGARIADALRAEKRLRATYLTADYRGTEDNILRPGALREDIWISCVRDVSNAGLSFEPNATSMRHSTKASISTMRSPVRFPRLMRLSLEQKQAPLPIIGTVSDERR